MLTCLVVCMCRDVDSGIDFRFAVTFVCRYVGVSFCQAYMLARLGLEHVHSPSFHWNIFRQDVNFAISRLLRYYTVVSDNRRRSRR